MSCELEAIRAEIDELDHQLAALIKQRQILVERAHKLKTQSREDLYDRKREENLHLHIKQLASEFELDAELLEDILRRILRNSYNQHEGHSYAHLAPPGNKKVVIVGGKGAMGQLFAKLFTAAAYDICVLDKDDSLEAYAQGLKDALIVIISVPIASTCSLIHKLKDLLDPKSILCDLTSLKDEAVKTMLQCHQGAVVGLHPMFGPDCHSLVKQVIVAVHGRNKEQYDFLLAQLKCFGANIVECGGLEHDKAMSIIQALRHFTTYFYGLFLQKQDLDLDKIIALSSPIYRLELTMVARLFAQDPKLYAQIIMQNEANIKLISDFSQQLQQSLQLIKDHDEETFVQEFYKVRAFFGDYASLFLQESRSLLAIMQDHRA